MEGKGGYFEPLCTARHLSVRFYDWEPTRYVGDFVHLAALGLCLATVLREDGAYGVSFKAHLLFFMVFTARFLNIFFCDQPLYLIIYKVVLWTSTMNIVMIMAGRGSVMDYKDTLPLHVLLVPTMVITLVFGRYSSDDHGLVAEVLWIFSNHLEGIAMLPQYIYCYRDGDNMSRLVEAYVLAMGGYQAVFGLTWISRFILAHGYLDISSLINGALGVAFFVDYLVFKARTTSPLSDLCISMDKGIRDASDACCASFDQVRRSMSGKDVFDDVLTPAEEPAETVGKPVVEIELSEEGTWVREVS
mmetsp:Transcript_142576/g.251605  ORF Transcript_142576/g.251605 Transcript_142576/m.251605 type:complete len:303 (+) Transcript_142576:123-1031(+)